MVISFYTNRGNIFWGYFPGDEGEVWIPIYR